MDLFLQEFILFGPLTKYQRAADKRDLDVSWLIRLIRHMYEGKKKSNCLPGFELKVKLILQLLDLYLVSSVLFIISRVKLMLGKMEWVSPVFCDWSWRSPSFQTC